MPKPIGEPSGKWFAGLRFDPGEAASLEIRARRMSDLRDYIADS